MSKAVDDVDCQALICTEGKTDWMHLKRALSSLQIPLKLQFEETDQDMGDETLKKRCLVMKDFRQERPVIFVFDRDNQSIVKEMGGEPNAFRDWGNNVYSVVIPVPSHRSELKSLSIEHFYVDSDLVIKNASGRRLFFSHEFTKTGRHRAEPGVRLANADRLKGIAEGTSKVVDQDVYDSEDRSLALSKSEFARLILEAQSPFDAVDVRAFAELYEVIQEILRKSSPPVYPLSNRIEHFAHQLSVVSPTDGLALTVEHAIRWCKLTSLFFAGAVIGLYQRELLDMPRELRKKLEPIRDLLSESFREPSLKAVQELARHCYYLVDADAPEEIAILRDRIGAFHELKELGTLLDLCERLVPPANGVITSNRAAQTKSFLNYVLPELARYETKIEDLRTNASKAPADLQTINVLGRAAVERLVQWMQPLNELVLRSRRLDKAMARGDRFSILSTTYRTGQAHHSSSQEVIEEDGLITESCELILHGGDDTASGLELHPLLIIRDSQLCFYSRTRVSGYEYLPAFLEDGYVVPTKTKFSHAVLKVGPLGDEQSLFWAGVLPERNESNGILANIPVDVSSQFVGRRKEIQTIIQDIVEIPNVNGIVYGVGGVGKTSLMIQLSHQLYGEPDPQKVLFNNIIWVSAKGDFYNPVFDVVEKRKQNFRSLDAVLTAIFEFFGYGNVHEYSLDDKKQLLLELLKEERILLILDNFETVSMAEQSRILQFFDVEVKRALRHSPNAFKLIVTSREQIPSGFRQIALQGLNDQEAVNLMSQLYEPYKKAKQPLSDGQREKLIAVTLGIPIILRHSFAQVYEHNRPVDKVIEGLGSNSSKVVDFSFEEIFNHLKQDALALEVLLLLETMKYPLSLRQIEDILEAPDSGVVAGCLGKLVGLQCIVRDTTLDEDIYRINPETRLATARLLQRNPDVADAVRSKIERNYNIEKRMQYTQSEREAIEVFNGFLSQQRYVEAEDFIKQKLTESPNSIALAYYYAKHLKENRAELAKAIELLEKVREKSGNAPAILKLLVSYYTSQEIPQFDIASAYVQELDRITDDETLSEIGGFFVKWSTFVKMRPDLDPLRELIRRERYKQLADQALSKLERIKIKDHHHFHLLAQCYYNKWDYDRAIKFIDDAIRSCPVDSYSHSSHFAFKREVQRKQKQFAVR